MEDVTLNNLRIVLKMMIYSKANEYHTMAMTNSVALRRALTESAFRIEIPTNQLNYMRTPMYFYRRRFAGRIPAGREFMTELYRFKFKITFCFSDGQSQQDKTSVLGHARLMLQYLYAFITREFSEATNELNLTFLMFSPQAFVGLYEANVENLPPNFRQQDVVLNGSAIAARWSRYYDNQLNTFLTEWYTNFRSSLTYLTPNFDADRLDDEVEAFRETHVLESPGLSISALNRLLGIRDPNIEKTLYVSWNIRLDFSVDGPTFRDEWLRNTNLRNREFMQASNEWRTYLNWNPVEE